MGWSDHITHFSPECQYFNHLTPKISLVILPTACYKSNTYDFNLENLVLDQLVVP